MSETLKPIPEEEKNKEKKEIFEIVESNEIVDTEPVLEGQRFACSVSPNMERVICDI